MCKNCYEATIKLVTLSESLSNFFCEKEKEQNNNLDGTINTIEYDFLIIKHSLEEIGCYKLALDFISLNNELMTLLDKKNKEIKQTLIFALDTRISSVEQSFLEIKHQLMAIPYKKTNRTDIFNV